MPASTLIANRFELGSYLSQGGMGTVYLGRDTQTQESVAIKKLKPDLVAEDPKRITRFVQEGEALRALNHPNIVKLLAAAQHEGEHYLVMEYVPGGSLADLLKLQPQLPISRVLAIALELSDALTRAHHLKIIHRDLKPANILLAEDGTPRLTDFGIARMGEPSTTKSSGVVGTISYVCPEAFSGETLDARADLWAFGVILFEMLSGKRPFAGVTASAIVGAILNQRTPDLEALRPDAPVALVDLIYRLLEKNREERLPSARLLGAELEGVMQYNWPSDTPKAPVFSKQMFMTPAPAPTPRQHNLPAQTTEFVGREAELAEISKLLGQRGVRLLSIIGPGGIGKTRLALEAALAQLANFADAGDGVYFVGLAPLNSPDLIVSTVAQAVGFQFSSGQGETRDPQQQLLDYLREKTMLLVVDNFEHILDGASLVAEILEAAQGLKILVTSRERLNMHGETLFRLEGLDFPAWKQPEDALEYSAVKLFLQSARRIQPGFQIEAGDLSDLARICRQVEGLPLGIVLAAGWIEALSLKEISDEIERSVDFLETQARDVPTRQRSIRAVFDYSWNLMSEAERLAFMRLSVFRGGWTRDAAQAVAGAPLPMLIALVNKSLLRRNPDSGRYGVHELLRQYAADHLAEVPEVEISARDAHCRYYSAFLGQREPTLSGPRQLEVMDEIAADFENVRAAWAVAIAERQEAEFHQMAFALWRYLEYRFAFQEMQAFFETAIQGFDSGAAETQSSLSLGLALAVLGAAGYLTLDLHGKSREVARRSLEILRQYDHPRETALALYAASVNATTVDQALSLLRESLQLFHQVNDQTNEAYAHVRLAMWTMQKGNSPEIDSHLEQASGLADPIGNRFLSGSIHAYRAVRALRQGNIAEAKDEYRQWLTLAQEVNSPGLIAVALMFLGNAAYVDRDYDEA
ncbi:MAG TPA: protein kinase, partial [Aggregatilineales bacterium]|nr:protein kinase [Aggregatilineales bacterium]